MIKSNGEKYCTLLSSQDGLERPVCVAYRKSDNIIVVGPWGINDLLVCHLSK